MNAVAEGTTVDRAQLRNNPVVFALIYGAIAGLWIFASDRLLGVLVDDADLVVQLSVVKGFAFVGVTAFLLFYLSRRNVRLVERALDELAALERERSATDAHRRRVEAIIESTHDAVISTTLNGTITSWNPAAETLLGYSAEQALGRAISMVLPDDASHEEAVSIRRIESGHRIERLQTVRIHADGQARPVEIIYSPIWAEGSGGGRRLEGVSTIVRDISARVAAQTAAEHALQLASALVEAMPGVFYLYDAAGRFLRWNRNFETVTGYSHEELAGMRPLEFVAGADKQLVESWSAGVFAAGDGEVEAEIVSKSGEATPYYFTRRRIILDSKQCLLGVGIDISTRKRAEIELARSEDRYRSTLETMAEGCQILDFDWRYLYLNKAAEQSNRRPNADLLGQRLPERWPGIEGAPVFTLLRRTMVERAPQQGEIEFTFLDGTSGWFDIRARPVPEGIFVLSIDITERIRAERALRELNEGLERIVAERTRDLAEARERAESADRTKSAFLATMSHELRTPLNSIIGFTGILQQGMAGPLTAEQTTQLGMVRSSARHLLELINDVLDISKIEAGQLEVHLAPFALRESVERVVNSVRPLAQRKQLTMHVELPDDVSTLHSDKRRFEQILINLLNNAIKFTDRGSVTLAAKRATRSNGSGDVIELSVIDTGIGMRQEHLSTLFKPFRQIDSGLQRQYEGTGLGLAICHRLVALLHGEIAVASEEGRGSVFTMTLPVMWAAAP